VKYVIFQYRTTPPTRISMPDVDVTFSSDGPATGNQVFQHSLFPVTAPPSGERSGTSTRNVYGDLHTACCGETVPFPTVNRTW
jgi:hypothetical protein